ncbi:unnamed protein product [Caenorhabditis brenneri]
MKPRSRWSLVNSWRRLVSNPDEMAALDVDKDVPLSLIKLIPIQLDMETMRSIEERLNVKLDMGGGVLKSWDLK